MFSSKDFELYEAIRELSILKELPDSDAEDLSRAEDKVAFCQQNLGTPSEMALLSRLHWWTVEYGLIGTLEDPKIYGAGLLSSIGESANCMKPEVVKLWYTIDAVKYPFDITKPQPQLFVTPDFQNLIDVLEQFADTMAFRRGGAESLLKAIECRNVCTAVYSSGVQVSGVFTDLALDDKKNVSFIKTTGPTAIAYKNKQLEGQDKRYHKDGFSSPVGKLKGYGKGLENFTTDELKNIGLEKGMRVTFEFESGITVSGTVMNLIFKDEKLLIVIFSNCTVKDANGKIYFEPSWGNYDMAIGEKIVSVFCGAADKNAYEEIALIPKTQTVHHNYTQKEKDYQHLFKTVRDCREQHNYYEQLPDVWNRLKSNFQDDWLCSLEILEILDQENLFPEIMQEIKNYLERKALHEPEYTKLINDGFHLIKNPVAYLDTV
jgi:phenylalanine-4-hydroxylase